jgi:hypothetical protein
MDDLQTKTWTILSCMLYKLTFTKLGRYFLEFLGTVAYRPRKQLRNRL